MIENRLPENLGYLLKIHVEEGAVHRNQISDVKFNLDSPLYTAMPSSKVNMVSVFFAIYFIVELIASPHDYSE